jgi:hypothetical protein
MIETYSIKGHTYFILPTLGFWKNDYTEFKEGIHYGLQFNWFNWQIGIIWKKK